LDLAWKKGFRSIWIRGAVAAGDSYPSTGPNSDNFKRLVTWKVPATFQKGSIKGSSSKSDGETLFSFWSFFLAMAWQRYRGPFFDFP